MKRTTLVILLLLFSFSLSGTAQELLIFGGANHKDFLGCLNCDQSDSSSIWNSFGEYGNPYSSRSIWNSYGTYGGQYGTYSPWNRYSSYPPVVVDRQGNFYGYLTTNEYKDKRATFPLAHVLYEYWEEIRQDIPSWYNRIFQWWNSIYRIQVLTNIIRLLLKPSSHHKEYFHNSPTYILLYVNLIYTSIKLIRDE